MNKACNNCNYGCADDLADYTCVNSESDRCADWVGSDDTCDFWEPKADVKGGKCDE